MDLNAIAHDVIKSSVKKGADNAEVFIRTGRSISVAAKNGELETIDTAKNFGIAIKVIKNHRLGFSFTSSPDPAQIEDILNRAVSGADWTAEDAFTDIPDSKPPSEVSILDNDLKNIKEKDISEHALSLEQTALDHDPRISKVRNSEVGVALGKTVIVNSKGVNISYESGYITASVSPLATDGQDSQMGWASASSRKFRAVDFSSLAVEASKRAVSLLGARKISTSRVPVLLDPSVAADFLGVFSSSLSAEAVQKKRSFLAGKEGKAIAGAEINLIDDGLLDWGIGTKPADDEGVPALKKTIISGGVLTGFIHNYYTAKKQGVESTGNASRHGYKSLPGIDVTNLYIKPSQELQSDVESPKSEERIGWDDRLIRSIHKGLLVLDAMGVHTANPVTGDFSVGVSGLWIENGEIAFPVKEAMMSGNVLDMFGRIKAVGTELKFFGKIGSPSLLIEEMDISA